MVYKRRLVLLAALLVCMTFGGCVYLRLLEVKNQLAKFDRYFSVEVKESFTLRMKDPLLYDSDILYVSALDPSYIEHKETDFSFVYQFVKVENSPTPGNQDLIFTLNFNKNKRLNAIVFSPVILEIVPADFLELSIRAVGHGKIDKAKRQLKGDVERVSQDGLVIPTYDNMRAVLGKPYEEAERHDGLHMIYRYELITDTTGKKAEDRKKAIIDMHFDPESKKLIQVAGNFAGMKISINYSRLAKSSNSQT